MKFVELPDCILDRIGYFILEDEMELTSLHNLRSTCKHLNKHFSIFLYTSLPVVLTEKSGGRYEWSGKKESFNDFDCSLVRDLQIYRFTKFYLPQESLVRLRFLTIEALDLSFLCQLPDIPELCSLSVIYNHRSFRKKEVFCWERELEQKISEADFPRLEVLRISSKKPKVNVPYKNLFTSEKRSPKNIGDYERQFSSEKRVKKYQRRQRKHHSLGHMFFMLMEKCKGSLKAVEVLGLDFSFVMSRERTIKFGNPATIILNNPSIIHAYSWMPRVSARRRLNVLIEDCSTSAVHVTVKKKNQDPVSMVKTASLLRQVRSSIRNW
ncbi:hypothetical protein CA3LBN_004791 [Candidozyma haemuli]|uniref:F-box domain-containing protein n=1 Tax=Candidozyma haemuli TaxID=45357 RepID=A0ABX8ICE5_9ASCO|nr:hypothetical protein CA3LBN_004791 [[Candida] haemuloni]